MLLRQVFFVVLLFTLFITDNYGYRCYKCMSTETSACGDPFDPTAPGIKIIEAKPDELCWATRLGSAFGRSVYFKESCSWGDNKCLTTIIDGSTITYCCCTSDLCNTQAMPQNTTISTTDHYSF